MLSFLSSQFLLYVSIGIALFIPGYFLIFATHLNKKLSSLESLVVAFGSSVVIIDFLIIFLGRSPFSITRVSVFAVIFLFSIVCYAVHFFRNKKNTGATLVEIEAVKPSNELPLKSTLLILLLIFLTIFIKTIYFKDTIFPTTTDLGHHMYWTKIITTTANLPVYEKADIGQDLTIEKPRPIADFVIGEHLIFAAIALLSGAEFIGPFPALVLFLIQIMSLLAIFILTRSLFSLPDNKASRYGEVVALMALFLIGPLYALATPQAKFVSGGVIGNTIGNLLIPLAIFFFVRAFSEKKSVFLSWGLLISLGLAYTHHLSTFVFIFVFLFTIIAFVALNFKTITVEMRGWIKLFTSPSVLTVLALGIIFVFLIYTPTYLNSKAIDTAVGAPSKSTRTGLTLTQLKMTAGEARFAFAVAGFFLLFFARKISRYSQAFMIGWISSLALMSLRPDWLFVDIPSNRIASYVVFPFAIVAACMIVHSFVLLKDKTDNMRKNYLGPAFVLITFVSFMVFVSVNGFDDNAHALNTDSSASKAIQTYTASRYLAQHSNSQDMILKDHNYLSGDTWIKLFFMRGYSYPLSRGYFKRYEDSASREQCTNLMISTPSSSNAGQCFAGTKTNFIMINPKIDSGQFDKLKKFWQIYSSDEVGIYYKSS